ncbi:helix-turn-helix domain-containing protein [Amycolatopsis sp. H20-H5]|uniref:helix-turn-helix domain-containing protein n=1 Tax=Amycolatopsis sp. H20-H5 TaxID=3046309 RepID=UPI002DB7840E|nr:helix-turn-helix domain-containing protein [Amycolatopsis sp. H20-H5]MEC3976924.1 helix-turn-helix domain-containing protein [Amycolatopsis sp. H20-H5]
MELRHDLTAVRGDCAGEPEIFPETEPPVLAVRKAISSMRARYFDPITLTELASEVFVSPFHFSRIFAKAIGVTPGRYLTALRMFEAKRLLLTTSLTVSDIVCSVGYSSVGTFTSRFTRAVGMTPTQYREPEVGELLVAVAPQFQHLPSLGMLREVSRDFDQESPGGGVVTGRVDLPPGAGPATVFVGLFGEAVPQRGPVAFTGLASVRSSEFEVRGVPDGRWSVVAIAQHSAPGGELTYSVGRPQRAVQVGPHSAPDVRIPLRGPRQTDLPIAVTLASRHSLARNRMLADQRPYLRAVA